ncbi:LysR family transcriptional regulator [Pigmentiphaga litoralis]|uniref:LysR family transcriptional regulator n=1 Tax=Pigmentiphaga litoralis TaxID=516702 RepID=UPI0016758715|nr:LysR family transcriptional regulator [Pigmentiphaga litoralis]GGX25071.1 LysR family transcriptional regulator [Pigmentiphaga litoralis]
MTLDIDDLRFVMSLDRLGSLAALAREENVTPPAITKRLHQLELRVGVRLVQRTTRRLQLTHEGHLLAQHASGVLDQMRRLEEALHERTQVVAGKLKVHGPLGFGRRYLAPLLAEFHTAHPGVEVQLVLSDNLDLAQQAPHGRDAFDVLVSIGDLPDSRWIAHPIAPNRRIVCAAPRYLSRVAPPALPADLADHSCLVLRENSEDVSLWRFADKAARRGARPTHTVRVHAAMESNDGTVIRAWCAAGKGIMARSEWDVAADLASGKLVQVLPKYRMPDADVVALVPQSRVASRRASLFIEALRKAFKPAPPWRAKGGGA